MASVTVPTPWLRARAGLGDVPSRLRERDCTVAYMGASVTAQKDGFRPRLHRLLWDMTRREHRAVAAGVGATGAITGVFLMDDLVLPHRPDLVFVEYATSDVVGRTPPAHLDSVLEGIFGKLRDAGCAPCFLYLHRSDVELSMTETLATYEDVADRHGIPSIDVAASIRARQLDDRALLRDVVHTTAAGSDMTAATIRDALAEIGPSQPAPPTPLRNDAFCGARLVPPRDALAADARFAEGSFRLVYPYVEIGCGDSLRFRTSGDLVGLLVVLGPHSGYVEVAANGASAEYLLWDEDCSYERLGSLILTPFARAGSDVTVTVSSRDVDRSRARRPVEPAAPLLKLVALMVLS